MLWRFLSTAETEQNSIHRLTILKAFYMSLAGSCPKPMAVVDSSTSVIRQPF